MVYWAVSQVDSSSRIRVRDGYVQSDDDAFSAIVDTALASLTENPTDAVWATLSATHVPAPEFGDSTRARETLIDDVHRCIPDEEQRQITRGARSTSGPHPTPPGSVHEQWARIEDWLLARFPENSISLADAETIEKAIYATGENWPSELVDLFELANGGMTGTSFTAILPRHQFLTLEAMVEERAEMIRIWADGWTSSAHPIPPTAGVTSFTFAPAFIPFAGLDGNFLFVDTRPGELYGCISEFDKSGSDERGPRWLSLSATLTDLADSLAQNKEFDDGWRWSTDGSALQWDWSRSSSVARDIARALRFGQ